jgi:hypothetical protein
MRRLVVAASMLVACGGRVAPSEPPVDEDLVCTRGFAKDGDRCVTRGRACTSYSFNPCNAPLACTCDGATFHCAPTFCAPTPGCPAPESVQTSLPCPTVGAVCPTFGFCDGATARQCRCRDDTRTWLCATCQDGG